MTPTRIQMTRSRPWRPDHPDAVIVDRRSKWGNPFRISDHLDGRTPEDARQKVVDAFHDCIEHGPSAPSWPTDPAAQDHLQHIIGTIHELRGKDLACWCSLDQACHADVLLEVANR